MKGKIDKDGRLHIERAGKMKAQDCPEEHPESKVFPMCGDWCPLFGEPWEDENAYQYTAPKPLKTELTLCQRLLVFDKFTDER